MIKKIKDKFRGVDKTFDEKQIEKFLDVLPEKIENKEKYTLFYGILIAISNDIIFFYPSEKNYNKFIEICNKLLKKEVISNDKIKKIEIIRLKFSLECMFDREESALKDINECLLIIDSLTDKEKDSAKEDIIEVYKTKMAILNILKKPEEVLSIFEDAIKYSLGEEYYKKLKEIYWDKGVPLSEIQEHPCIGLYYQKALALDNLGLSMEAIKNLRVIYDMSTTHAFKMHCLQSIIGIQKNNGLFEDLLLTCNELINIYNSVEFPKSYELLNPILEAYFISSFINLLKNKPEVAILNIIYAKKFLENNKEFFKPLDTYKKRIQEFANAVHKIPKNRKEKELWVLKIDEKLSSAGIDLNVEKSDIQLREYKKSKDILIKEISEFSKKILDKELKSDMDEFLNCLNKKLEKSAIRAIRPILEDIMNILIYNEKITKKDYQNFICTHKKVKENNRNESIPLTLFGKIILLRWHFKNKDIELYRNKIKRFFDSIDGLRDEFNSVMHSSKYNNYLDLPYNIRSILEDIIYILRWYEKYKKNSTN